ncbi:hypothetical protein ACFL5K_05680 [Gemmatimonadota bacterium]
MSKRLVIFPGLALLALFIGCGPELTQRRFEHGPLTAMRLLDAASAAGFLAREVIAEIPAAAHSRFTFKVFDYDNELIEELRLRYRLEEIVAPGEDEWARQLLLKNWVAGQITNGNPTVEADNALEILEYAAAGKKFYCTYFAITYIQCAQALGWQARKLGLDRLHGPDSLGSTHHGVAEIWSNRFAKWVVIDAQSNLHFEKNSVPLSAWEIRAEWLKNQGRDVKRVVGIPPNHRYKNPGIVWWDRSDEDETACYFWIYFSDNATRWDESGIAGFIFPQDSVNAGLTWYQNDYAKKKSRLHTGYLNSLFRPTERIEDAYWTVGFVEAELDSVCSEGKIFLSLDSYCPNLTGYEATINHRSWEKVQDQNCLVWPVKEGWNSLGLRTVSRGNIRGKEASVSLLLE